MEWPLYTESESDFGAELKWRDNSNCHVAVGRYIYNTFNIAFNIAWLL
jgi:nitric oxide synthase oxygenase domain/subunit